LRLNIDCRGKKYIIGAHFNFLLCRKALLCYNDFHRVMQVVYNLWIEKLTDVRYPDNLAKNNKLPQGVLG
jgi:hypothetical protein